MTPALTDTQRMVDWDAHLSVEGEKRVLPSLRVIISQFQVSPLHANRGMLLHAVS